MIRPVDIADEMAAVEIKSFLQGRRCWYAYAGVGSTVSLALGRKFRRERELKNKQHPPEYRRNDPESDLLVWCSWRLDGPKGPLASSDNDIPECDQAIGRLIGRSLSEAAVSPGWELRLVFTGGYVMSVFPDHVGASSFDGNWEIWRPDRGYLIGRDLALRAVDREYRPMRPRLRRARRQAAEKVRKSQVRAGGSRAGAARAER